MQPSIDPASWVLQFAALLLEVWRDSDARARRRHQRAVENLAVEAAQKADAIAQESSPEGGTDTPEGGFGAHLLDGDDEAIKVLIRVAVDPAYMPPDRRWWPDSVVERLAGLHGPAAAQARVWLDELPFLLLEGLQSNVTQNPLSELRLEALIAHGMERLKEPTMWPSVRERRLKVEAYLREVLRRATAPPAHGGWGVARVSQPVRVLSHDTRDGDLVRSQEGTDLAADRDPYSPKGGEADRHHEPPRL